MSMKVSLMAILKESSRKSQETKLMKARQMARDEPSNRDKATSICQTVTASSLT